MLAFVKSKLWGAYALAMFLATNWLAGSAAEHFCGSWWPVFTLLSFPSTIWLWGNAGACQAYFEAVPLGED